MKKNVEIIWNNQLKEIIGNNKNKLVEKIIIQNTLDKNENELSIDGLFVAIGHKPATEIFKNKLEIDEDGYILTKADSTKTNVDGIFAAGDVTDKIYRQAVTAAGMGCMGALEAEKFLSNKSELDQLFIILIIFVNFAINSDLLSFDLPLTLIATLILISFFFL